MAIIPQFYGAFISFVLFHIIKSIWYKTQRPLDPYFGNYLELRSNELRFSFRKIFALPLNVIDSLWSEAAVFGAFYFLGLCKNPINSGIIVSLFSLALVFTCILFYIYYN